MRLLLDTHVLLWWLASSPALGRRAKSLIASPRNEIHVSTASIVEIALKIARRRVGIIALTRGELETLPSRCGFIDLPVSARHAAAVLDVPSRIADPFDRLLLAQAASEDLRFITADRVVLDTAPDLLPADR